MKNFFAITSLFILMSLPVHSADVVPKVNGKIKDECSYFLNVIENAFAEVEERAGNSLNALEVINIALIKNGVGDFYLKLCD